MGALGLAASAYRGFTNEQSRLAEEERTARRWQSEQEQLGLRDLRARADKAALPEETELRSLKRQAERGNVEFGLSQQPTLQEIARIKNQGALAAAPDAVEVEKNRAKVARADSEADVTNIPALTFRKLSQGVIDQHTARDTMLGTFAQLVDSGDKPRTLQFLNEVAKIPGFYPQTDGRNFVDVQVAGGNVRLLSEDGSNIDIPISALKQSMTRIGPKGNYQAVTTRDGAIGMFDKNTGRFREVKGSNPDLGAGGRSGAAGNANSKQYNDARALVESGEARSVEEGLQKLKARDRATGISRMMQNDPQGRGPEYWAPIYDKLQTGGYGNQPSTASGQGTTISPNLQRFLTR